MELPKKQAIMIACFFASGAKIVPDWFQATDQVDRAGSFIALPPVMQCFKWK
jgi:hypothetical protein